MLKTNIVLFFMLTCFLSQIVYGQNQTFELKTIVIDAGHGGKDPGANIGKTKEKDIVLDVALRTGLLIEKEFPNVKVIYTRNKDVFVPLDERADIANKQKADLFLSIHVNSFSSEKIAGAETYILGQHRSEENLKVAQMENSVILLEDDYTTRYEGFDPNSAESYIMFELIQNEFLELSRLLADQVQNSFIDLAKRKSRGVRQAGFLVLRRTTMPSILVELGYISNNNEKRYLETDKGKQTMAVAIANAFKNYKTRVDNRSNMSMKENSVKASSTPPTPKIQTAAIEPIKSIKTIVNNGTWYAVQIAASAQPLNADNSLFKNEFPVYVLHEKGWYKYYLGTTKNHEEIIKEHQILRKKYKGAFPVVFINGKKEIFRK